MADLAKIHLDKLKDLKKDVESFRLYFQRNIQRYHMFKRFVFKTSLTESEKTTLTELGKPTIEFNILEATINRLRGEFAKQEPSLTVRAADGVTLSQMTPDFIELMQVIEAHLRAMLFDASNDSVQYDTYTDLLAGGFSVLHVYTDYVNEMSFEQNIYFDRVFDPTLCGFDPLARASHKGDGRYCYTLYPMTREEFEERYGSDLTKKMKFTKSLEGFHWSYRNENEDIVLVCDFYQKRKKRVKIIKLSNGHTVQEKHYKKFLEAWEDEGFIEQPPIPVGDARWTDIEDIVRYRFCESQVLDYTETNYKHLPLVFVDGNSIMLTESESQEQMTRPYVYQAQGIQMLKNFAGQTLAAELENMIQHKFIVARESIDEDYTDAYDDVQKADVLIYNHLLDRSQPDVTLPAPREVVRTPIPPQISETFRISDEMTQTILGTFDSAVGKNQNSLSGIAIARGAINSNNASVPYIVGYIKGLNRVAQIVVDLIPKYYRTPRSLPIVKHSGKREYQMINTSDSLYMHYDPNSLNVKVETGVNFAIQKEMALQSIISLMQASPLFGQFMNAHGLEMLLDNIDIRGIEELKMKAAQFEKELSQNQQMQQQIAQETAQIAKQKDAMQLALMQKELQSPTQNQVFAEDVRTKEQKNMMQAAKDAAELNLKEREVENDFLRVMAQVQSDKVDSELKQSRVDAENTRSAIEAAINISKHTRGE